MFHDKIYQLVRFKLVFVKENTKRNANGICGKDNSKWFDFNEVVSIGRTAIINEWWRTK